ncbi:MAG: signal peptide peptidase SppA, partial [Bacteroidota bacterium]
QFRKYRETPGVKAIVLRVDSPGGGVSASQEIYEEVKKTRDGGKPVVVSMGSVAASGGYYVACGADRIMANPGTLTGSIGVIFQFLQFEELMKRVGVEASTFKSGELKDIGSPFRKTTPREREYFAGLVNDVYDQFVNVVSRERNLSLAYVKKYADGRVFTGRQALAWGFVDTLGTYEDAIALAGSLGGIKGTPRTVRERKRRSLFEDLMGETVTDIVRLKEEILHQPMLQYRMSTPNER